MTILHRNAQLADTMSNLYLDEMQVMGVSSAAHVHVNGISHANFTFTESTNVCIHVI